MPLIVPVASPLTFRWCRGSSVTATFVLVHGSGDGGRAWHPVRRALHELGHAAEAPDLPTNRDATSWEDCAAAVVSAIGEAEDVLIVGMATAPGGKAG